MSRAAVVDYLTELIWPGLSGLPIGRSLRTDVTEG